MLVWTSSKDYVFLLLYHAIEQGQIIFIDKHFKSFFRFKWEDLGSPSVLKEN